MKMINIEKNIANNVFPTILGLPVALATMPVMKYIKLNPPVSSSQAVPFTCTICINTDSSDRFKYSDTLKLNGRLLFSKKWIRN
jgi:hypothetical protein